MARWAVVLAGVRGDSQAPFIMRSWVVDDKDEAERAAERIRASLGSTGWQVDVSELIEAASAEQIIGHFSAVKRIWGDDITGIDEVSPGLFRFRYEE